MQDLSDCVSSVPTFTGKDPHTYYLDILAHDLTLVGEPDIELRWVLCEGIWKRKNTNDCYPFPDILAQYQNGRSIIIELKHSDSHRDHALKQIYYGEEYFRKVVKVSSPIVKKITYYDHQKGKIRWETLDDCSQHFYKVLQARRSYANTSN
jgi:hypothetical protein